MKAGSRELRVGIFVTLALVVGGIIIFLIGNQSAMFASKVGYEAIFDRVNGLRAGSPVRVAGVEVGSVESVTFGEDGRVDVKLDVRSDAAKFVREGSTASVGSKGLLGDQLIDISVGRGSELPPGSTIPTSEESILATALGETGEQAEDIVRNIDIASQGLAEMLGNEQTQGDIRAIAHNLAALTRMVQENDGTVRRLLTDPEMADEFEGALRGLRGSSSELNMTLRGVRRIVTEVERGHGTAHEVIYGQQGIALLTNLASAAGELATILRDVRTGDNNAHQLLYGDEAGNLIANLTAASADLRAIVANVRAGRGTIGGLLVDPSIYEDIKRLVGNLQRNTILRSLVRYSIRHDQPAPQTPEPRAEAEGSEP